VIPLTLPCAEAQDAQNIRPILLELCSVNHRFWSGPRAIVQLLSFANVCGQLFVCAKSPLTMMDEMLSGTACRFLKAMLWAVLVVLTIWLEKESEFGTKAGGALEKAGTAPARHRPTPTNATRAQRTARIRVPHDEN